MKTCTLNFMEELPRGGKGHNNAAAPDAGLHEPPTSRTDRRSYARLSCGRAWRKVSGKWRCPYCGYAREKARP